MKKLYVSLLLCMMAVSAAHLPGLCADNPQANAPRHPGQDAPLGQKDNHAPPQQPIRMMQPGLFQMGNIIINKNQGLVSVKGQINMQDGLVKYLACSPQGKLHECILSLDVDPSSLQTALVLAGFEPGTKPLGAKGAKETPSGEKVDLIVSWPDTKGKSKQVRAEQMIYDKKEQKVFPKTPWVFTGSATIDNKLMASVEHSIVAIYHDPYALFDHPLPLGSDDSRFYANKDLLPVKGTHVTLTIKSLRPGGASKKTPAPAPAPPGPGKRPPLPPRK